MSEITQPRATEYEYDAQVTRFIDGDTVELYLTKTFESVADFGFRIYHRMRETVSTRQSFRLIGINTPEMKGETIPAGKAALEKLKELLSTGQALRAVTYKPDKYGRWLVALFVKNDAGEEISVNKTMIDSGHAVVYAEQSRA
jgi:endonuclease YncB( thermonuclease family)